MSTVHLTSAVPASPMSNGMRRDLPGGVGRRGTVTGLGFVPGTHRLIVSGTNGFLAIVDADRGRVIRRLSGHSGDVLPAAISADGRLLVTGSADRTVRVWSLPDATTRGAPLRFGRAPSNLQVSPDGRSLTIVLGHTYSSSKATLEVWDPRTRARVRRLAIAATPTAVNFSPDGRLLAVGYPNGRSHLWSTATWKPISRLLAADTGDIYALAISPDGEILATGLGCDSTTLGRRDPAGDRHVARRPRPRRRRGRALLHVRRIGAHRELRHRHRIPLGHPAGVAGPPRMPGCRPTSHTARVERVPAGPRLRPRLLSPHSKKRTKERELFIRTTPACPTKCSPNLSHADARVVKRSSQSADGRVPELL